MTIRTLLIVISLQLFAIPTSLLNAMSTQLPRTAVETCCICLDPITEDTRTLDCCKQAIHDPCIKTHLKKLLLAPHGPKLTCPLCRQEIRHAVTIRPRDLLEDLCIGLIPYIDQERLNNKEKLRTFLQQTRTTTEEFVGLSLEHFYNQSFQLIDTLSLETLHSDTELLSEASYNELINLLHALTIKYNLTEETINELCRNLSQCEVGRWLHQRYVTTFAKLRRLIKHLNNRPRNQECLACLEQLSSLDTEKAGRFLSQLSLYYFSLNINNLRTEECVLHTFALSTFISLHKTAVHKHRTFWELFPYEITPHALQENIYLINRLANPNGWPNLSHSTITAFQQEHVDTKRHQRYAQFNDIITTVKGAAFIIIILVVTTNWAFS